MKFKRPYPVDALPPILAATVKELCANSSVQAELAAPLVLGVASLACQGAVDVARPNCEPSPCLLYTVVISGSGTRKSTVLNKLLSPIREVEQELAHQAAAEIPVYEAAMLAWEIRKKYLLAEIEKKAKKNESLTELQEQLSALMSERPFRPVVPKFVYEDPTPEAVIEGICKTWHSAAMISSEGAGFFNGRPSGDLPMWNKLWDGAGVGVERVNRGALFNNDARCGMILAVQEGPFQEFCESRGAQAIDIGFLARVLISRPPKQISPRFLYDGQPDSKWFVVQQFQNRVKALLLTQATSYREKCSARTVLELSSHARQIWIEAFNEIESQMQPGGELAAVPGYASKIGENAARIAAVFHWFEGKEGEIDAEDIHNALVVCRWHADEYLDCFSPPPHVPLECRDADTLERWLVENVWNRNQSQIRKNEILQFGPNQLRTKARLDDAISVLISGDKIRIARSSTRTRIIELNPHLFPKIAWGCKVDASSEITI